MTVDEIGVGPWVGDWPADERYDPELLAHGDRRNVVDRYRYWRREAVVADLDRRRHPFHVAIENWQHDFNIGTVVRNANAFLAAEVHIVGRSEEHTSELQSRQYLVCRLLLEKKKYSLQ